MSIEEEKPIATSHELYHPSSGTFSDNLNQEDYISQFLTFPSSNNRDLPTQNLERQSHSLLIDDQFLDNPGSSGQSAKRTKSAFHNFQKHLVTTLRHSMDMACFQRPEAGRIQAKLWNFFMQHPRMTRTLLYLVYGGLEIDNPKNKKILKQYGLNLLLKNESWKTVREAQRNLREETLKQAQNINLDWELGNRRMKKKAEFRIYFSAFLEELRDGYFSKRIPKSKREMAGIVGDKQNINGISRAYPSTKLEKVDYFIQ